MVINRSFLTMALAVFALPAGAQPAFGFCRNVESMVNTLVEFTSTTCVPTAGGGKGTNSFIFLSEKPVFSTEASKKAWLVVACAAAGSELNKRGALRADELWFSDIERTRQRLAYVVPAAVCKSLQPKVHAGAVSIDQMYGTLSSQLVRKEVPK
jgi:hypothetical protein